MANTSSAKKAARVAVTKRERNISRRSRVRTFLGKVEDAIATGKHDAALAALRTAESEIKTAVSKGVYKLETASRKISRLNARVKKLKAA